MKPEQCFVLLSLATRRTLVMGYSDRSSIGLSHFDTDVKENNKVEIVTYLKIQNENLNTSKFVKISL